MTKPSDAVRQVLLSPSLAPRSWVYRQFDREVGAGTLLDGTFAPAAVVRVPETEKAVALSLVCDSRHCALDPHEGAKRAVVEGVLRAACVGATAIGATDCLNYGSPLVPSQMGQLAAGVDGISEACRALDVPVVSGNVSLYNQTDDAAVLPTPAIGIVGVVDDLSAIAPAQALKPGDVLIRLGAPPTTLEGSLCAWQHARGQGRVLPLSLEAVAALVELVRALRVGGHVLDAWPISSGGLAHAVFSLAVANDVPARATLPDGEDFLVSFLGEDRIGALVAVDNLGVADVLARAAEKGIDAVVIGALGVTDRFTLSDHHGDRRFDVAFADLVRDAESVLPNIIRGRS